MAHFCVRGCRLSFRAMWSRAVMGTEQIKDSTRGATRHQQKSQRSGARRAELHQRTNVSGALLHLREQRRRLSKPNADSTLASICVILGQEPPGTLRSQFQITDLLEARQPGRLCQSQVLEKLEGLDVEVQRPSPVCSLACPKAQGPLKRWVERDATLHLLKQVMFCDLYNLPRTERSRNILTHKPQIQT